MIILDPVSAFDAGVFVSSSVPGGDKPVYDAGATYTAGFQVMDAAGQFLYESKVASNTGNALTDTTKWLPIGCTNRYKMLDAYNNTQTVNPESIVLVMSPKVISQGLFLGNMDANEVGVTVTDAVEGVVRTENHSLIISDSASSFFNWAFKRIRRKTYFITTLLPVYANATVTITISKPGGIAKCGMCCLGPLIDVGLSEYGLSTEIKDYSSTTFNFDGTSKSMVRDYAKRMSVDISISNELIDSVQEQLAALRQKTVVFIGAVMYGSAIVCGKYSSFKNVINSKPKSKMAMQIEGVV